MTRNADRPWITALEMQFSAAGLASRAKSIDDGRRYLGGYLEITASAGGLLSGAESFAWARDCSVAVRLASRSIHSTIALERTMLPHVDMWWWFGSDVFPDSNLVAILLSATDRECVVSLYAYHHKLKSPAIGFFYAWDFGTPLGELTTARDTDNPAITGLGDAKAIVGTSARFVLAALTWLGQRIATTGSGPIERHKRKQLAREFDAHVSDVKIVQLRRTETPSGYDDSNSNEAVDWSCRWIVNGHWRNQPYANGEHKLIYILPYVKGPDDKPLKVPTHTVYAVNR